jgi:RRXRR protein
MIAGGKPGHPDRGGRRDLNLEIVRLIAMTRIPVVSQDNKPLMPTTPAKARKLIASGKAVKRWSDCGQFYIQLNFETGSAVQDVVIGVDPGKRYSGIGVQSAKVTLYTAHLVLPFKTVRGRMDNRRMMRRGRRGRRINRKVAFSKRAHRQKRFSNRRQGKLAPSIRANRQLELRIVTELAKIYPITAIRWEYVKADVDLTSGRKKAKSGKGFSAVMIGQQWMLEQLERIAPTTTIQGFHTANVRKRLGLEKHKADKSKQCFEAHAVDGVAIAASRFVEYRQYHRKGGDGATWVGEVTITKAPFYVVQRPPYSRRQLHLMIPAKGGIRRKYGGSVTSFGFRKGDFVQAPKFSGFVSGETGNSLSISDVNWKRLGRVSSNKISLVRRSNGLLVSRH